MALQISQTRIDFFSMLSKSGGDHFSQSGNKMLLVIQAINDLFVDTEIIGTSSHANLILFSPNDELNWLIFISSHPKYQIRYKSSFADKSVGDTEIFAEVDSIEDFKKYLVRAMKKTESWNDSFELERLLSKYP